MKQLTKEDLNKLPHKFQVAFALFCAKQVAHLIDTKDKEVCDNCIEIVEAYLEGKASKEDCERVAYAAAADTAVYAANAANAAAYTANTAAYYAANAPNAAANKEQTIKEQHAYYNELLNFDKVFEEVVL